MTAVTYDVTVAGGELQQAIAKPVEDQAGRRTDGRTDHPATGRIAASLKYHVA